MAVSEMSVVADVQQEQEQDDGDDGQPPPAARASTLSIEVSMKVACRNRTFVGRDALRQDVLQISPSAASISRGQRDGVGVRLLLDATG